MIRHHSPAEAVAAVAREISAHPEGTAIGISAPPHAGCAQFLSECEQALVSAGRTVCCKIDARDFPKPEAMIIAVKDQLEDELGTIDYVPQSGISFGDNLFFLLQRRAPSNDVRIVLLAENAEVLPPEKRYELAVQLRNVRERRKASPGTLSLHSLFTGRWSAVEFRSLCRQYGGSYPFDLSILLGEASLAEFHVMFQKAAQARSLKYDDLHVEYLHELAKGCYGIAEDVLGSSPPDISCAGMLKYMTEVLPISAPFVEDLRSSLTSASPTVRNYCLTLLRGRRLLWHDNNPDAESALLSGLVTRRQQGNAYYLELRSWPHEVALRRFAPGFFPGENLFSDTSQLIPPSFTLNRWAYTLVMEAENELRNLLTLVLARAAQGPHPFSVLDALGPLKQFNRRDVTVLEYCTSSQNSVRSEKTIDAHSSLVSYLDLSDICELFTDNLENRTTGMRYGIYEVIREIFPDRSRLKTLLGRLRDIRNPVAHNNLITEDTIIELQQITGELRMSLVTKGRTS